MARALRMGGLLRALAVALAVLVLAAAESARAAGCGDGTCNWTGGENCISCPADCGQCIICGDGVCAAQESCSTCPRDCPCPVRCGDGTCSPSESCSTCPGDCGSCPVVCGDGTCQSPFENCYSCELDCGVCGARCGDGTCLASANENCDSCPQDCGNCGPYCGDGVCNGVLNNWEGCSSCPGDCGPCSQRCGDGECTGKEGCGSCERDCGSCSSQIVTPDSTEVIVYLPDYSIFGRSLQLLNISGVTDYVYFSVVPRADGSLDTSNINTAQMQQVANFTAKMGIRTHVCIGGWGRSDGFPALVADLVARVRFIKELRKLIDDCELAGLVLDWEHPANADQVQQYTTWINELYRYFHKRGKLVSVAVPGSAFTIKPWTAGYVDRVHIMSYDNAGRHHSTFDDARYQMDSWAAYGIRSDKLVLALPFYGKRDDGRVKSYKQLLADIPNMPPDVDSVDGYMFNGLRTIERKVNFTMDRRYRGVAGWEFGQDTVNVDKSLIVRMARTRLTHIPNTAPALVRAAGAALVLALSASLLLLL